MRKQEYILGLVGSPRKGGNTDILVTEILKTAAGLGARTEVVYLGESGISPCQACGDCRATGVCRQKDGMCKLLPKLHAADGIVLGSPAYFGTATAQTKTFIDRLIALYDPKFVSRIKGTKKGAVVFVWAGPGGAYARELKPVVDNLAGVLKGVLKAKIVGRIAASDVAAPGDAGRSPELIRKARAIGGKLAGAGRETRTPV